MNHLRRQLLKHLMKSQLMANDFCEETLSDKMNLPESDVAVGNATMQL